MTRRQVEVITAGQVSYGDALDWQRSLARARIEQRLDHDVLLLLEHPPVLTLGRGSRRGHVLQPDGIEIHDVERGGDVTFHGPGQIVGYPILDLTGYRKDLHWYLRTLEDMLIGALHAIGFAAERRDGLTGVWTGGRKIGSIGVHVRQWVTWHGFALNVHTDLDYFRRIVPCGIAHVEMTSLAREALERKRQAPAMDDVVQAVIRSFETAFTAQLESATAYPSR